MYISFNFNYKQIVFSVATDKDVIRTDRELDMFRSINSPRLVQLQDILNTYVIYNFDLGIFNFFPNDLSLFLNNLLLYLSLQ